MKLKGFPGHRPRRGPVAVAPRAALAAAHGGVNLVRAPNGQTHLLGIMATSVLMGYDHDRFTKAAAVVNDPAASWRALGNTIQADDLEDLAAPWIAKLRAAANAARAAANATAAP